MGTRIVFHKGTNSTHVRPISHIRWKEIIAKRIDVDGVRVTAVSNASKLVITYRLLAAEMTCRANHLDSTHVHIMPPYTWMLPTRGVEENRIDGQHIVKLIAPKEWHTATQLEGKEGSWVANGRDEFLDAIMESNSNEMITFMYGYKTTSFMGFRRTPNMKKA